MKENLFLLLWHIKKGLLLLFSTTFIILFHYPKESFAFWCENTKNVT